MGHPLIFFSKIGSEVQAILMYGHCSFQPLMLKWTKMWTWFQVFSELRREVTEGDRATDPAATEGEPGPPDTGPHTADTASLPVPVSGAPFCTARYTELRAGTWDDHTINITMMTVSKNTDLCKKKKKHWLLCWVVFGVYVALKYFVMSRLGCRWYSISEILSYETKQSYGYLGKCV